MSNTLHGSSYTLLKEQRTCPNCFSKSTQLIATVDLSEDTYISRLGPSGSLTRSWDLCSSCKGAFSTLVPTSDGIPVLYTNSITSMRQSSVEERFHEILAYPREKSEAYNKANWFLSKYKANSPLHILDYGCGMGVFLAWLRTLISEISPSSVLNFHGLDPSLDYIENCKTYFPDGEFTHGLSPSSLPQTDQKYDVISLITVLEHLLDPHLILGQLKSRLRPNGVFWIEVPSILNFQSLPINHDNFMIQHLFMHSHDSLVTLFDSLGCKLVSIADYSNERGKTMTRAVFIPAQ